MNLSRAYRRVIDAIESEPAPRNWIVAFSGGKDSSLVLKLFWTAFLAQHRGGHSLEAIYCDTGSENPLAAALAKSMLDELAAESAAAGIAFKKHVLMPPVKRRLLVRIAGRGYPPPNTFFRWCTKDLRIRPVEAFMGSRSPEDVVVLGVRSGESKQRDRSFGFSSTLKFWSCQLEGTSKHRIFMPIADFSTEDVWDGLHWLSTPAAIPASDLWALYEKASGECPIIRLPDTPPCGSGRFGCWLCTVVRKDKSAEHLIAAGHNELQPLIDFRSWLLTIRNEPSYRCTVRRSGAAGLGPFRLSARREILRRVKVAEQLSGLPLLTPEEEDAIHAAWAEDATSGKYAEDLSAERERL